MDRPGRLCETTPMLVTELPWRDPLDSFAAFAGEPYLAFLDSAAVGDQRAEFSYLCLDPVAVFTPGPAADPLAALAAWLARHRPPQVQATAPLPFTGGAVGFLGYDLGRAAAGIASRHPPIAGLPDAWFGLYDTALGFDHRRKRLWLIGHDRPDSSAAARLASLTERLATAAPLPPMGAAPDWQPEWTEEGYRNRVELVRAYIEAGDIFQANLTHRFHARRPTNFSAAGFYAALRRQSPAPFASFLSCGDEVAIISASPEAFLRLSADGKVETRPIKGTIRRGATPEEDEILGQELSHSAKDRAENLMIADLMRNDLGRVCEIGSVKVTALCAAGTLHQRASSGVGGRRAAQAGPRRRRSAAGDIPPGSITGAPKHRAMQIIDEIETGARGAYCGTLAWLGFDGAMGSSVMIRSIVATKETLFAQAGGGIVWDSDPAAEYAEMRLKVAPLLAAGHD